MSILDTLRKTSAPTIFIVCLSSVTAGCAAAAVHGNFEPLPASLFLLFAIFAQFTVNFGHRLNDERYSMGENIDDNITGYDPSGEHAGTILREATIGTLMLTAMLGLTLCAMGGWWMLLALAVFSLLALAYAVGPFPLSRTVWAPVVTFFIYGPVGVLACCLVQSQHQSPRPINWYDLGPALIVGTGIGLLAANALILHNYISFRNDIRNNKMTFTAAFGTKVSRVTMIISSFLSIVVFTIFGIVCRHSQLQWLVVAPVLGFVATCYLCRRMRTTPYPRLCELQWIANTIILMVALATFIIVCLTGVADDSKMHIF